MPVAIKSLFLSKFLSFPQEGTAIDLLPLNVMIGPNASGKSNFIESLRFLKHVPLNLDTYLRTIGYQFFWNWRAFQPFPSCHLAFQATTPDPNLLLTYEIDALKFDSEELELNERLILDDLRSTSSEPRLHILNRANSHANMRRTNRVDRTEGNTTYQDGSFMVHPLEEEPRIIYRIENPTESVFSQFRDSENFACQSYVSDLLKTLWIANPIGIGSLNRLRLPQDSDLPREFLQQDFSNLASVLNRLAEQRQVEEKINDYLRRVYELVDSFHVVIDGRALRLVMRERNLANPIPASRLSDGTLWFCCLLALLSHPKPPPLVCLEEPELGLHPDLIHVLAEMLVDAATRTQIIVTTHSDRLVTSLGQLGHLDSIVVCERGEKGTEMRRLDAEKMAKWLDRYTLGELWLKGQLGGKRW
jgi:predicted ATPase